jgi:hypothetical protein
VTLALDEKILALDRALAEARIPHAFGGALALAYYATPRGTIDVDLNVFVPVARAGRVLRALAPLGVEKLRAGERAKLAKTGRVRLRWGHTPIDLFFSYDPFHDGCERRMRTVPFGRDAALPVLSAEDLAVFKAIFDREKDARDLAEMLYAQGSGFDADYALDWLRRILEPGDPRLARFEAQVRGSAGQP